VLLVQTWLGQKVAHKKQRRRVAVPTSRRKAHLGRPGTTTLPRRRPPSPARSHGSPLSLRPLRTPSPLPPRGKILPRPRAFGLQNQTQPGHFIRSGELELELASLTTNQYRQYSHAHAHALHLGAKPAVPPATRVLGLGLGSLASDWLLALPLQLQRATASYSIIDCAEKRVLYAL
jgi:hypothetical protein